jgi:hypothetical protein
MSNAGVQSHVHKSRKGYFNYCGMPGPTNCHVGAGVTIDRDLVSVAIYDREQSRLSGISRAGCFWQGQVWNR